MQRVPAIGGVILALAFGVSAYGQTIPHQDTQIAVAEVEVRSGPSQKFYATSKLHLGDTVKIVAEKEGGWLAIEPPPGSFSWINDRFLDRRGQQRTAVVLGPEATVLVGSSVVNTEPDVKSTDLKPGTVVVLLDPRGATNSKGVWLPIQPPVQEVRYIPADAIKRTPPVQAISQPPAPTTPVAAVGASTAAVDPLLAQAEQAERAGNLAEAERLYTTLSRQTPDQSQAMAYFNKADALRKQLNPAPQTNATYYPTAPATQVVSSTTPGGQTPVYAQAPPYPPQQAISQYSRDGAIPPIGQAPPSATPRATAPAVAAVAQTLAVTGHLRPVPFRSHYLPTYALETSDGRLLMYVTVPNDRTLDPYVNRAVTLTGPTVYDGEVRQNVMSVTAIALVQ